MRAGWADRLLEKLIKIGVKVVSPGRYVTFQMAEVAVSRQTFNEILSLIAHDCGRRLRQREWRRRSYTMNDHGRGAP